MIAVNTVFLIFGCRAEKSSGVSFSGDVMLDGYTRVIARKEGEESLFTFTKDIYTLYDYNVVNLECPLTDKNKSLEKQYSFKADNNWGLHLRNSGITHALLNNNHSMDCGIEGLKDTYLNLKKYGIIPIGGKGIYSLEYINTKYKPTVIVSSMLLNDSSSQGSVPENYRLETLCRKIKQLKLNHYMVFVSLHWGIEYLKIPSGLQKEQARMIIDAGADAIIGHHSHVVQQIEFYKGNVILYSLGNLIFTQQPPDTRKGIIAGFNISKDNSLHITLYPFSILKGVPVRMERTLLSEFKKEIEYISPGILLKDSDYGWDLYPRAGSAVYLPELTPPPLTQNTFPELYLKGKIFDGYVSLTKLNANKAYRLELKDRRRKTMNMVMFKYNIYRMQAGDIDNDGNPEVMLGIVKSSKFDPVVKKRIFILRIDKGKIRPLWLGTGLCRDLIDFHVIKTTNGTMIRTIEKEDKDRYCTGEYCWNNFGLRLVKYTNQHISLTKADEVLNREVKI